MDNFKEIYVTLCQECKVNISYQFKLIKISEPNITSFDFALVDIIIDDNVADNEIKPITYFFCNNKLIGFFRKKNLYTNYGYKDNYNLTNNVVVLPSYVLNNAESHVPAEQLQINELLALSGNSNKTVSENSSLNEKIVVNNEQFIQKLEEDSLGETIEIIPEPYNMETVPPIIPEYQNFSETPTIFTENYDNTFDYQPQEIINEYQNSSYIKQEEPYYESVPTSEYNNSAIIYEHVNEPPIIKEIKETPLAPITPKLKEAAKMKQVFKKGHLQGALVKKNFVAKWWILGICLILLVAGGLSGSLYFFVFKDGIGNNNNNGNDSSINLSSVIEDNDWDQNMVLGPENTEFSLQREFFFYLEDYKPIADKVNVSELRTYSTLEFFTDAAGTIHGTAINDIKPGKTIYVQLIAKENQSVVVGESILLKTNLVERYSSFVTLTGQVSSLDYVEKTDPNVDSDTIWYAGTTNGDITYGDKTRSFKLWAMSGKKIIKVSADPQNSMQVYFLTQDLADPTKNEFYLGNRTNKETDPNKSPKYDPPKLVFPINNNVINGIILTDYALYQNVYYFTSTVGKIYSYDGTNLQEVSDISEYLIHLKISSKGILYAITDTNILFESTKTVTSTVVDLIPETLDGLNASTTLELYEWNNVVNWIVGTDTGTIIIGDEKNNSPKSITIASGDIITTIFCAKDKWLYLGTKNGLLFAASVGNTLTFERRVNLEGTITTITLLNDPTAQALDRWIIGTSNATLYKNR